MALTGEFGRFEGLAVEDEGARFPQTAREQLDGLRAPAVTQLGHETIANIEARARKMERTEHAEAAVVALRSYLETQAG